MAVRHVLGPALLLTLAVLAGEPARAETWCIRDAGSPPPGACVFPSAHDCGNAARLNPFGGICEREPLGYGDQAQDKRTPARRPAKHRGTKTQ
jgi:hypothetical protein